MKKMLYTGLVAIALINQNASAILLASDQFSTGNTTGDYTTRWRLNQGSNASVLEGTIGYGTNEWIMGTSFHQARNDIFPLENLIHLGATDNATGVVFAICGAAGEPRVSTRVLDTTTVSGKTYYFSGLVNRKAASSMDVGETITMGLQKYRHVHTNDFSTGIHLGVRRFGAGGNDYKVAVFAGGQQFDLQDAGYQKTYQVVIRVDVDAAGTETLWAWSGETNLTQRLVAESVETWNSADNFEALIIQSSALLDKQNLGGVMLDAMRFGTTMADVTTLGESLRFGQVASESFSTDNSDGDYSDNISFSTAANREVLEGNAGFVGQAWAASTTLLLPRNIDGLTHSGLIGSAVSGVALANPAGAGTDRNVNRGITDVPTVGKYYVSGLFKSTATENFDDGCVMAMGIGGNVASTEEFAVSKGVHVGLYKESGTAYLGVFAGGNTYQLAPVSFGTTYQIIAELVVDANGQETLSAWYAADGATSATEALTDQPVETYGSPSDLEYLVLNAKGGGSGDSSGILMDELRFGVNSAGVTTYQISEDSGMGGITLEIDGTDGIIYWEGTNLLTYALQGRDSLNLGTWSNLVSGIDGVDGVMSATNSTIGTGMQFYRVIGD